VIRPAPGCDVPVVLCAHAGGHGYDRAFTREVVEFFRRQ
jgi:hypothetical protein